MLFSKKLVISAVSVAFMALSLPTAAQAAPAPNVDLVQYSRLDFDGKTHYYVDSGKYLSYDDARTYAANHRFKGLVGYVPTISSDAENSAVSNLLKLQEDNAWLGLQDTVHNEFEDPARDWNWMQGPEFGTEVTACSGFYESCTNAGPYVNWADGEPSNFGGTETIAEIYPNGYWNDRTADGTNRTVVEFTASSILPDEPAVGSVTGLTTSAVFGTVHAEWAKPANPSKYYGSSVDYYHVALLDGSGTELAGQDLYGGCYYEDEGYYCWDPDTSYDFYGVAPGAYTVSVTAFGSDGRSAAAATAAATAPDWVNPTLPADNFTVVAAAARADVTFDTGYDRSSSHTANGSSWYFNTGMSWGFAKAGAVFAKSSCDGGDLGWADGNTYADGGSRLCWHLSSGSFQGGWRAGNYLWLNGGPGFRAVYVSNAPTYYPYGPQPNVSQTTLADGGWKLCFDSGYGDSGIPVSDVLKKCQGAYLLLAGMAGANDWSPVKAPSAPTSVSAVAGNGQVTVSWSAPASDGGASITGYTVSDGNGHGCSFDGSGSSCTVTGLTNGTAYAFTVTATNSVGTSDASASAGATPFTTPDAPTVTTVTGGDSEATVSWSEPHSDGGAAITAYTVTASTGQTCSTAIGVSLEFYSCTVTGLDNLKWLTFTVTATNVAGDSAASDPSDPVVLHTSDFQVWVPSANVARDGGTTDIYVFGATGGIEDVRLKVGNQVMHDTPDENGTVVFNFTAYNGAASRWKAQARAVRGTGTDRERLYAFSWVYAPKISMRKSYANGAEIVLKAGTAAPDTELSVQVDGVEVCRDMVGADGKFVCTLDMDTTAEGDHTAELFSGDEAIASRDFTIRPARNAG